MTQTKAPFALIILAAILIVGSSCLFTVDETKSAIVLQFGNPKKVYSEAGLKFKLPFPFQEVTYFDKRILNVDPEPERVNLSSDGNNPLFRKIVEGAAETDAEVIRDVTGGAPIIVDTFARYRITDPLAFLQRLRTEASGRQRIESIMNAATRDILGKTTLGQLLSPQRAQIVAQIRDRVNAEMKDRGVEIVDIRIVRADLTERLLDSTVNRMITERKEQATKTRSTGEERALEIKSTAEKERSVLLAEAQRDSQIIRGEGDRDAIRIYSKAFNQDKDFYSFQRSMEAYRNVLSDPDTRLILSPDNDFLRYMKDRNQ